MMSLNELLNSMGATNIEFVAQHETAMTRWIDAHHTLFIRVCENKPDKAPILHLLGVLTKSHIEANSHYQNHTVSYQAMQQALNDTLGHVHADKFTNQSAEDLTLITHLWLFTQGYLHMDYSLAHDHAEQTQSLLSHELTIKRVDLDVFRNELMKSFYLGKEANPEPKGSLLGFFRRLFS